MMLRNYFLFIIFIAFNGHCAAEELDSKSEKILSEYVRVAFGPDRPLLKKIDSHIPIAATYRCLGLDLRSCHTAQVAMGEAIHVNDNLKFDFRETPSTLEILFANRSSLGELSNQAQSDFIGGFKDISDSDCQLFYSSRGAEIEKVRLLFAADQPALKLKFCIAVQLYQGLGLNSFGGIPFANQWSYLPGGLAQITEAQFSTATGRMSAIEFIHMCPDLHSGMTYEDVIAILSRPKSCLSKLVPFVE